MPSKGGDNMKYMYNPKTNRLHIEGYCCHTKGQKTEYIPFDSEDEALAYDGRSVGMCKLCQRERNKRMEEK